MLEELARLAIKASILVIVFQLGTKARSQDIFFLFRQPSLLLRSLLSMSIIVPGCAVALALAFELNVAVKWALVTLALSPVPPVLPVKQIKAGACAPYAISLLVVEALAAIVFVPAAVAVCAFIFHYDAHIEISTVALTILVTVLAPLVTGMLAGRFAPTFAERIGDPVGRVGSKLLLAGLAAILLINARGIVSLFGSGTVVAIVAFNVLGFTVGHLLGGPKPVERAVLALASATRHPGVAFAILAANLPDYKSALTAVDLFVVIGMIFPIAYFRWWGLPR
jgi:bile acid:Na+ symporter, BASS family